MDNLNTVVANEFSSFHFEWNSIYRTDRISIEYAAICNRMSQTVQT